MLKYISYGAGACQLSPSDSAKALVKALAANKQTPRTLKRVAVVVIDPATVQAFVDVLRLVEKQTAPQKARKHDIHPYMQLNIS